MSFRLQREEWFPRVAARIDNGTQSTQGAELSKTIVMYAGAPPVPTVYDRRTAAAWIKFSVAT
jgi:hypothetical protein